MADAGAAQAGDALRWAHLDERLRPWLRGILGAHRLPMGYGADDVINLTFAHVYRDFDRFRVGAGSSFRAWVLAIMLNRLASLVKMAGAQKRDAGPILPLDRAPGSTTGTPQIPDHDAEPASMLARHAELARDFRAAIADLDPQTRAILEMRVLNDMEFEAIAACVGREKADTVRAIFNRAMEKVRRRMRAHADS
jgi:RNA polymerase sigma factor (sigma-70 family)